MVRLAVCTFAVLVLAAGCGGTRSQSGERATAYLTDVTLGPSSVRFVFDRPPGAVRLAHEPKARTAECGSGKPISLAGEAVAVVHFVPAATAKIDGEKVVRTYTGPRRFQGSGPFRALAKTCDFESDLAWAIGVAEREDLAELNVSRAGNAVTVSIG
jgi:hypothetical protein